MRRQGNTFAPGSSLFTPSIVRGLTGDAAAVVNVNAATLSGSIQSFTQSFRYDPPGSPIKSTQQIPLDWSKFENHTFFSSAEAKINTTFDLIINNYPFDGSKREVLEFLDSLTGFEKYVLDIFPKSLGYLNFSGSGAPSGGTHLIVRDRQGAYAPSLSKVSTGKAVLDQGEDPISFEMHLRVPPGLTQGNQVVLQRLRNQDHGITLALSSTLNTDASVNFLMLVSSGSSFISASMPINKGEFHHVCAVYDSTPGVNAVRLYQDFEIKAASTPLEMGAFGYGNESLTIASGTNHKVGNFGSIGAGLSFSQTFSGSIDELRVFHSARNITEQKRSAYTSIYAEPHLKLYYKFNEPTGSFSGNSSIIDTSGNGLHTSVTNTWASVRGDLVGSPPLHYEHEETSPVLFPSHPDVVSLNESLLVTASEYDANNPNLISKLIPRHYLQEASIFEGFDPDKDFGTITDEYGKTQDFPGGGKLGSAQIIASLLFIWAKHFDEIKIFLDQFGKQRKIDPIEAGTIANSFLPYLAETYGITLPDLFPNSSVDQFYGRATIKTDPTLAVSSLQQVQNQIWRRILSDMVEIIRSKGTLHSIKSLIRDMGLNPDSNFRFREFGGTRTGRISDQRVRKTSTLRAIEFSGSHSQATVTLNPQGIPNSLPHLMSPGLLDSGTLSFSEISTVVRDEPGYPLPGATPAFDRILTSGSWTYEATYKLPAPSYLNVKTPATCSLVRFATSGSENISGQLDSTYINLIALSGSELNNTTSSLMLVFRDTWSATAAPTLYLPLTGVNIFDGDYWHICFGRRRNDDIGSVVSSSWFLRAAKQQGGNLSDDYENSVYFDDSVPGTAGLGTSILTTWGSTGVGTQRLNMSGTVIHIGSQSIPVGSSLRGLSHTSVGSFERDSFFGGRVMNLRFWTKALTDSEKREHTLNPLSVGAEDAKTHFNFVNSVSGSWEKVRVDLDFIQETSDSDALGNIRVIDMSQNLYHFTGTGFESNKNVLVPELVTYSTVNPYFDQATNFNKIRVRSWKSQQNIKKFGGVFAPLHEIPQDEQPVDDTRFSIEINAVQALNEDIIRIFSTLESFDNYIGRPELQFSEDYPDLQTLRDIYFNRLNDKVNFKTFFSFFKWFDSTISQMIENLIPQKTKFLGVNFVVEPHMLERPKIRYNTFDLYLGPNDRAAGQLLLQQLVGVIRRY
jgi:hypothetical protein